MIKANNIGTPVDSEIETELLKWTADGNTHFLGFMGTGDVPATFRLSVKLPTATGSEVYYVYKTNANQLTAYVVDRATKFPANTLVTLTAYHLDPDPQNFYATFLGGNN